MTGKDRQSLNKAKKKALGLVRVEVWVLPASKSTIKKVETADMLESGYREAKG